MLGEVRVIEIVRIAEFQQQHDDTVGVALFHHIDQIFLPVELRVML